MGHKSPDGTFLDGVHSGAEITAVSFREFDGVGEGAQDPYWTWRMDTRPYLRLCIFRPHGATPDLGVVKEEQLIVGHVQAWQICFFSVQLNPLLVSSVGLD